MQLTDFNPATWNGNGHSTDLPGGANGDGSFTYPGPGGKPLGYADQQRLDAHPTLALLRAFSPTGTPHFAVAVRTPFHHEKLGVNNRARSRAGMPISWPNYCMLKWCSARRSHCASAAYCHVCGEHAQAKQAGVPLRSVRTHMRCMRCLCACRSIRLSNIADGIEDWELFNRLGTTADHLAKGADLITRLVTNATVGNALEGRSQKT